MHELSIANNLLELITQQVAEEDQSSIRSVKLRVGALSCVHRSALLYSFDLVTEGTPVHGAVLEIETVPVSIFCAACNSVEQLANIQSFRCPKCNTPSADIRSGRELELYAIELDSLASPERESCEQVPCER